MKIIKPTIGGHKGDSFRELLDLWEEKGLCSVEPGPTQRSTGFQDDPDSPEAKCWIEKQGEILLYDFPLLDRLRHDYKLGLFGNTIPEGQKNNAWIFWPWKAREYLSLKDGLFKKYNERALLCGFIGTPTNQARHNMVNSWPTCCSVFGYSPQKINYVDYLKYCSNFKFGLCLTGVGPKCLRDIEYIGLGTVPVFSPGVSSNYHNKLIAGTHYIEASNPKEALLKMENTTQKQWEDMSQACLDWYEENCSIKGSFKITLDIIEKNI